MDFELIAIDLDGTLLSSDKRLSVRAVRAVQEVSRRGVRVVLASARPPRSVREIYQHLKLDTLQINYNGALIYDPPRGCPTFHRPLAAALARQVIALARSIDPQVVVNIETLDKGYTDRYDAQLATATSLRFKPNYIGNLDGCLREPTTKLMLLAPPDRISTLHRAVAAKFAGQLVVLVSDAHLIQVVHPQVDKAAALARVAQQYGVAPARVMAIGDAPNDAGMLRWAGLGAAVQNGWPEALAAANVIVASNDDDGVAQALERYVLGGDAPNPSAANSADATEPGGASGPRSRAVRS